jgi:hypothetical protein
MLQHEFRRLPDNERTAAVLAAEEAFDRAALTSEDLFKHDLDPIYLERNVRQAVGDLALRHGLSEAATALYGRLLAECSTDIVELATALPGFSGAAFTELLRRESVLIDMVRELLDRVPAPETPGCRDTIETKFAAAYRRQMASKLDRLELFGVNTTAQHYPLSVAYMSLSIATRPTPQIPDPTEKDFEAKQAAVGEERVEQILTDRSRLLIRGEAGSGKTTLMQWLAVRSARYDFPEELARWNSTMPFFLPLRHYIGRPLPEPHEFVKHAGRHIGEEMPDGWVINLLREGRALVLVDGVDELPPAERHTARRWLRDLVRDFPDARYVITSRPAAVDKNWLISEDFTAAELEPMSPADVEMFIHKWHDAMRCDTADNDERIKLDDYEHQLKAAVLHKRHLTALVTNPLMCALLCALHLDRRTQLPRDRMEVYSAGLEMLLERRDLERGINSQQMRLTLNQKKLFLQEIAYWLLRNGWTDASFIDATSQVARSVATMHQVTSEPEEIFRYLLERSGLLREPIAGRIDFVHRTFQEYLAARAILDVGDLGILIEHAHEDQWHEVVVMAAGHAGEAVRERLLRALLDRAEQEQPVSRDRLHLTALCCLETSPRLPVELRQEIEAQADRVIPPRTMAQAHALASAGDFALERLAERPVRGTRQAAATIRAACTIGGTNALSIIAKAARVTGDAVEKELFLAWRRFPPREFTQAALADTKNFQHLVINDPCLLEGLNHLRHLMSLTLQFREGYGDISVIADIPRLQRLWVLDPALTDLSPLLHHPSLSSLELRQAGQIDTSVLRSLPKLTSLDIDHNAIGRPEDIANLSQLETLQFHKVELLQSVLHFLPKGKDLQRFGIWNAPKIVSLSRLFDVPQLSQLDFLLLGGCETLTSIKGIETWSSSMTGLYLHAPTLVDPHHLQHLTRLRFLNLKTVPIGDATFISKLTSLHTLHLGSNKHALPDLTPLRGLSSLTRLFLSSVNPIDLTPLAGIKNLHIGVTGRQRTMGDDLLGRGSYVSQPIR